MLYDLNAMSTLTIYSCFGGNVLRVDYMAQVDLIYSIKAIIGGLERQSVWINVSPPAAGSHKASKYFIIQNLFVKISSPRKLHL
jgi:hypothetical protein